MVIDLILKNATYVHAVHWNKWRFPVLCDHWPSVNKQSNVFLSFAFSPQSDKQQALLLIFIISGGSRIFPRGGREPSRGGVNTPNFPENCMKSKEFGRPGGGVRPSRPPLDPPMIIYK